jgi:tRNA-dihydrouridine synthase A
VKCRIGVDEQDDDEGLYQFVDTVRRAGCSVFIVHARKAWLKGLSPKENREIPPLNYARVHRLKQEFADLTMIINGGIVDVAQASAQREHVDGVMIGRAAYHDPYVLARVHQAWFAPDEALPERRAVLHALRPYVDAHLARGERLHHITRHLVGLFLGQYGGRAFRRVLSEHGNRAEADWQVVEHALAALAHGREQEAA